MDAKCQQPGHDLPAGSARHAHLSFNQRTGTWWRLWQHRQPEPLGADGAAMLRPSDIDKTIQTSNIWIMKSGSPTCRCADRRTRAAPRRL
jgi:hypothetical protein